jgi:hypothetical protein
MSPEVGMTKRHAHDSQTFRFHIFKKGMTETRIQQHSPNRMLAVAVTHPPRFRNWVELASIGSGALGYYDKRKKPKASII